MLADGQRVDAPVNVSTGSPHESQSLKNAVADGGEPVEQQPGESNIDFAKRFAALTRREREIQKRDQAAKEREKAIEAELAELREYKKAKENAKLDPLAYLKSGGLDFQMVTDAILADDNLSTEEKAARIARAEIEEFKRQEREAAEKKAQENEEKEKTAKEQRLIDDYKANIKTVLDASDEYEFTRFQGDEAVDLVFDVVEAHYEAKGELLTPEQAAKEVEKYYEARYKELRNLGKFKNMAPDETQGGDAPKPKAAEHEQSTNAPRTLTNRDTLTSTPLTDTQNEAWVDDEESKRRAAAFLQKALNQQKA